MSNNLLWCTIPSIYRVGDYFSLITTHKLVQIVLGFTTMLVIIVNCVTCFWLLLTANGLCANCKDNPQFDWRVHVLHKVRFFWLHVDIFVSYRYIAHIGASRGNLGPYL